MNGTIYYYSGTGNTRLACEAIAREVASVDFHLIDIAQEADSEALHADFVGFATWADFWNPPQRMKMFMAELPKVPGTPAFVLNTFGAISGRTLATLGRWAAMRGFRVVAGHSLHTPENFPPMIRRGYGYADAPSTMELEGFRAFVADLDNIASRLSRGERLPGFQPGAARWLPAFPRTRSRNAMGEKHVDEAACTECGTCREVCPYGAIRLDPRPVFDQGQCFGCWACYNLCPTNAIYTKKIRGVSQYTGPGEELRAKLGDEF